MNSVQIEENVKDLVQNISNQSLSRDEFVYELLLAYGHRKSVVSRVKSGERNLSKIDGEVILKRHLYFKPCRTNLFAEVDEIKRSKTVETNKIRFVIVTDFNQIIAVDTKTQDTLDIELNQLPKHFDFFLPWAGMEKMVYRGENPADVKAAEKMADFFDHIKEQNYPANASKEQLHELVVFLNRLLFCFFAEDTKIFGENQFTNLLNQHTSEDGSDVTSTLERLFEVLNKPAHQRGDLPQYLASFPYVNGGLFKKEIVIPSFDAKARRMLLDSGQLDWADINPDIFGSMIQGVADPDTRSKMGMHYTSVTNIMKVIEPLFLNDFYDEFEKCKDNINKLRKLQVRLSRIKVFDPACGSGNFLIIAYKEIRLLEIEILKRIRELEGESDSGAIGLFDESHSSIRLDQFYGIELDDFAHEMAILSLWLVEHQMNMVFETEFGYTAPTLPLKQSGRIVRSNATNIDWDMVCPSSTGDEIYIMGNPPYLGGKKLSTDHKSDMTSAGIGKLLQLDYISCWFVKASSFIKDKNAKYAFVSTKSVCQGEQVAILWPLILNRGQEIEFAYTPFDWSNNAKGKAGVTCIILGIRNNSPLPRYIYDKNSCRLVREISPYLIEAKPTLIRSTPKAINGLPKMCMGSNPVDGKNLVIDKEEYLSLVESNDAALKYIKKYTGGSDFLYGKERYCLWIDDDELEDAQAIPFISERITKCREYRENAGRDAQKVAQVPYRFCYRTHKNSHAIVFPKTTTENRRYVPCGFTDETTIINVDAFAVYDAPLHVFALLSSRLHVIWLNTTSGKLRTGHRYSVKLSYNTFPTPKLDLETKSLLEQSAINILSAREVHADKSLSWLYDPKNTPIELIDAHRENDQIIESLYGCSGMSEDRQLKELLDLYTQLTDEGR
ncbi:YeeA [Vibrio nigripulchritudo MADA3029]|uniref:DNA methyltransferase n=1 Tax=Vibrio nigripulchritudo TaxID=28173 RepID=UPI0003B2370B|nr:DNA methyltransferase [Vibrio nigripulchritudo]CCN50040.1 YeeA [Vibrio nigripulchritudo MADA3020]CCN56122.1 YeeA [Vibrio nigripulchritudo MADA3021]CCN59045.1 YeeA [Vibrio nigripulchritudo MADA3029]